MTRLAHALLAASILLLAGSARADLEAGAAKQSIVPPFPTVMGGYFDRTATFEGVDRPVYARALVCRNGETAVAVLVADLIGVSRTLVEGTRQRASAATGLAPENILIAATHTHAGPAGFTGGVTARETDNAQLDEFLIGAFTACLEAAWADLKPAELGFAYGRLDGITTNRQQNNDTAIDPDVGVLKIQEKGTRNTIATLANFTGHPVILDSTNLLLSCEYPGVACDTVEGAIGGVALFTQGACGDITMKRSGPKFDEVTRLGRVVGGEIIATAEQIAMGVESTLRSRWSPIVLEPRVLPAPDAAEAGIAAAEAAHQAAVDAGKPEMIVRDLRREISAANTTAMVARAAAERPELLSSAANTSWHVLQIGPMVAVGMPGELFVEYGLEMKRRVAQDTGRPMILVGYANDYIGYIITPRADATGGYEKAVSRVAPTAGRMLTEAAMAAVREIVAPVE